jgi:single-strand DNA-binding protein
MNVIILTGNCTKDIEMRFTPNGKAVANGTIAVKRDFKNQNGEYETDFFNFVALGKTGEIMANHIHKGDKFGIKGKLQNRVWESEQGKKYFTEVLVDGFDFPQKAKEKANESKQDSTRYTADPSDSFKDSGQIDIKDDDLPF